MAPSSNRALVIAQRNAVAALVGLGLARALAMVWMTWWPLVLGFTLAGIVPEPSAVTHCAANWDDSASFDGRASLLGALSSSCSYAASAMARALFARGASWRNSLVFMVASTNLVIELGVVLYLILRLAIPHRSVGRRRLMIGLLGLFTRVLFRPRTQSRAASRVLAEEPSAAERDNGTWRTRLRAERRSCCRALHDGRPDDDSHRASGRFSRRRAFSVRTYPRHGGTTCSSAVTARGPCSRTSCSRRSSPSSRSSARSATSPWPRRSGDMASPSAR